MGFRVRVREAAEVRHGLGDRCKRRLPLPGRSLLVREDDQRRGEARERPLAVDPAQAAVDADGLDGEIDCCPPIARVAAQHGQIAHGRRKIGEVGGRV